MMLSDRDIDIVKYIAKNGGVYYSNLVEYVKSKYNIGPKAVSKIVNRLINERVLCRRRIDNQLFIDIDPSFVAFIVELYALLMKEKHRVKYYERKLESIEST